MSWLLSPAGALSSINLVGDVTITTPSTGDVLEWNGSAWLNVAASAAEVNDLTVAVTWADVPDANITEGSVTQHVAAIDHDSLLNFTATEHFTQAAISITGSQVSDFETVVAAGSSTTANTAKVTNATHTGDVTGSGALTIAAKAVDVAMLADGTDGELITWSASGVADTVDVGTATHVLTSNGVGVAPTFQAGVTELSDDSTPVLAADLEAAGKNLQSIGVIFMAEQAAADADVAGEGQWWTLTATPNLPMFTNDIGNDQLIDPSLSTINTQNVSYTLVITDKGKTIHKASGGAGETITIPANASVAFPIGTLIAIENDGGGTLTVAITTDTLTWSEDNTTGSRTLADGGACVIQKMTATTWKISGSQVT